MELQKMNNHPSQSIMQTTHNNIDQTDQNNIITNPSQKSIVRTQRSMHHISSSHIQNNKSKLIPAGQYVISYNFQNQIDSKFRTHNLLVGFSQQKQSKVNSKNKLKKIKERQTVQTFNDIMNTTNMAGTKPHSFQSNFFYRNNNNDNTNEESLKYPSSFYNKKSPSTLISGSNVIKKIPQIYSNGRQQQKYNSVGKSMQKYSVKKQQMKGYSGNKQSSNYHTGNNMIGNNMKMKGYLNNVQNDTKNQNYLNKKNDNQIVQNSNPNQDKQSHTEFNSKNNYIGNHHNINKQTDTNDENLNCREGNNQLQQKIRYTHKWNKNKNEDNSNTKQIQCGNEFNSKIFKTQQSCNFQTSQYHPSGHLQKGQNRQNYISKHERQMMNQYNFQRLKENQENYQQNNAAPRRKLHQLIKRSPQFIQRQLNQRKNNYLNKHDQFNQIDSDTDENIQSEKVVDGKGNKFSSNNNSNGKIRQSYKGHNKLKNQKSNKSFNHQSQNKLRMDKTQSRQHDKAIKQLNKKQPKTNGRQIPSFTNHKYSHPFQQQEMPDSNLKKNQNQNQTYKLNFKQVNREFERQEGQYSKKGNPNYHYNSLSPNNQTLRSKRQRNKENYRQLLRLKSQENQKKKQQQLQMLGQPQLKTTRFKSIEEQNAHIERIINPLQRSFMQDRRKKLSLQRQQNRIKSLSQSRGQNNSESYIRSDSMHKNQDQIKTGRTKRGKHNSLQQLQNKNREAQNYFAVQGNKDNKIQNLQRKKKGKSKPKLNTFYQGEEDKVQEIDRNYNQDQQKSFKHSNRQNKNKNSKNLNQISHKKQKCSNNGENKHQIIEGVKIPQQAIKKRSIQHDNKNSITNKQQKQAKNANKYHKKQMKNSNQVKKKDNQLNDQNYNASGPLDNSRRASKNNKKWLSSEKKTAKQKMNNQKQWKQSEKQNRIKQIKKNVHAKDKQLKNKNWIQAQNQKKKQNELKRGSSLVKTQMRKESLNSKGLKQGQINSKTKVKNTQNKQNKQDRQNKKKSNSKQAKSNYANIQDQNEDENIQQKEENNIEPQDIENQQHFGQFQQKNNPKNVTALSNEEKASVMQKDITKQTKLNIHEGRLKQKNQSLHQKNSLDLQSQILNKTHNLVQQQDQKQILRNILDSPEMNDHGIFQISSSKAIIQNQRLQKKQLKQIKNIYGSSIHIMDQIKQNKDAISFCNYNRAPILQMVFQLPIQYQLQDKKFRKSEQRHQNLQEYVFNCITSQKIMPDQLRKVVRNQHIYKALQIVTNIDQWMLIRIVQPCKTVNQQLGIWLYCLGIWRVFIISQKQLIDIRKKSQQGQEQNPLSMKSYVWQIIELAVKKACTSYYKEKTNQIQLQELVRMISGLRVTKLKSSNKALKQLAYSHKKHLTIVAIPSQQTDLSKWNNGYIFITRIQFTPAGQKVYQIKSFRKQDMKIKYYWIKQEKLLNTFSNFLVINKRFASFWTNQILQIDGKEKAIFCLNAQHTTCGSITVYYDKVRDLTSQLCLYKQIQPQVLKLVGRLSSPKTITTSYNTNMYFDFSLKGTYYLFLETCSKTNLSIQSTSDKLGVQFIEFVKKQTMKNQQCEYVQIDKMFANQKLKKWMKQQKKVKIGEMNEVFN